MGSLLPGWDQVPSSPPPAEFKWSVDRTGKRRSFDEAEAQREPRDEPDEGRLAKSEELAWSRSAEIKRRSWDWWAHTPSSCLNDPLRPEPPPSDEDEAKGKAKRKTSYTPQHTVPHNLHVEEPAVGWTFKPAGHDGFDHPRRENSGG